MPAWCVTMQHRSGVIWSLFTVVFAAIPYVISFEEYASRSGETSGYSLDELGQLYRSRRALPSKNTSEFSGELCHGHNNEKGRCLPLEKCVLQALKENYIKYKGYYCFYQQKTVGVCCPNVMAIPDKYDENNFKPPRRPISQTIRTRRSTKLQRTRRNIADEVNVCGRNGRQLSKFKNQLVENKAWPWAVSIINADTKEHHCGGTLVSRYHVLSAAHCVYIAGSIVLKERILARLGEYDFRREDDTRHYDHKVADLIYHEDYDEANHENDIALLILERPAIYNIYVQPACLPGPDDTYDQQTAVVIGWGTIEFAGRASPVIREVEVPVWEHEKCVNSYAQNIFTTNVCAAAYEGGKDACQKDSGGPLMIQRADGRWKIIGIVSWGFQCAIKGKPGIYTRVNKYLDWISEQLADRIHF